MLNDIGFPGNIPNKGRTTIKVLNPKFKHISKPATLIKDSNNFHKVNEDNIISTSGEQPLLLYKKKEAKISHSFDYKMTKKNSDKNIYISDGGLKLKNKKFNSGYNYTNTNTNQNHKQIKSLRNYLESINVNKLLKTPAMSNKKKAKINTANSKKNIPTEEHIFYKTVRGSSNRPAFQKKFYNNEKSNYHTGEGFYLREKIENIQRNKKQLKNNNKFEDSKKTEENRNELIDSLICGFTKNKKKFLKQIEEKKLNLNEILNKKKRDYLKRYNIGVSDVNLDENEKQIEKDEINKMSKTENNFNHAKLNNYVKISNGFSPKQKDFYMTLNNETHLLYNKPKNKQSIKPIVDQFEYIKKINKYKRLNTYENLSKKERDKILINNELESKTNQILNDSFRHKITVESKNKTDVNNPTKKNNTEKTYLQRNKKKDYPSSLIDVNNDEWPYSHKRSYRSPKELNKFVKEKKLQSKQKENNDEIQKNKKLFIRFKNLYNLNYTQSNQEKLKDVNTRKDKEKINKINNKINDKVDDKIIEKINENSFSTKFSMINKSIKFRQNNAGIKKRKEANEYYVGNDSLINNNSTLIDPNEYYLNVLESQQLLVNSGLNKIGNESDEETEEISEINEDNIKNNGGNDNMELNEELNTSKGQIQKIMKKESKRSKINNINKNKNLKNNANVQKNFNIITNNNITKKNNKKEKIKNVINSKNIIKFVEMIKFIIQRKIFIILYQSYINEAIYQHYYIAFTFFIAICKHKIFRKIEEYSNYKTYNHIFRKMLLPFIKRSFRIFVHNNYLKRKIEFLVILLSKFFKFKIMEKIFIYSQVKGGEEKKSKFKLVILKIMKTLFKPHLKNYFDKLKNFKKEEKNAPIEIKEEKKIEKKIVPKDGMNDRALKNEKIIEDKDEKSKEKYKKINKRYLEYSPTHINKARSYMYESFDEESSYDMRPNSLDNDKWHQIQTKLQLARYMFMNNDLEEEEMDYIMDYNKYKKFNYPQNNSFNSKKSEKSANISNEKTKDIKLIKDKDDKIDEVKVIEKEKKAKKKDNNEDIKIKNMNDEKNNKIKDINIDEESKKQKNINSNEDRDKNNIKKKEEKVINKEQKYKNKINAITDAQKKIENNINLKNEEEIKNIKNQDDIENKRKNDNIENIEEKSNKEVIIKNTIPKKEIKDEEIEEDEKIKLGDTKIKQNNEEKPKNKKKINEQVNAPKKEKKKIEEEDALSEKSIKNKTTSEIDISAEKDEEYSIDWDYNLYNSKNQLKESDNQEILKKEELQKEKLMDNNNRNKEQENKPNKIKEDKIINEELSSNKEEVFNTNKKIVQKPELIDEGSDSGQVSEISERNEEKEEDKKNNNNKKTNNKTLKKDKKKLNDSEEEYMDEFNDIDSDINSEKNSKKKNNIQNEKEKGKEKKVDNSKDKTDKSRNNNLEKNIKDMQIEEKEYDKKINKISKVSKPPKEVFDKIENKEQFSKDITDIILKNILDSEIKSNKIKIIPHKSFKYEFFTNLNSSQSNLSASLGSNNNNMNKELGLLGLNQLSLNEDLSSLNDSIMSSYSAFSVFNRTIKDKKKEHSLTLYYKKIAPKLIKLIKEEIYLKYPRIYENISMPLKNHSIGLMMSLSLQDADMLRDNYKCVLMKENIKNIIDKEKILKEFQPINKQIRSRDNLTSDNFYDNFLNECLVDTAIELINKERLYGENGDPLAWSSRTHELFYKYKKDDPSKLAKYVCSNILKTLHTRIGLLTENYDYLNAEQINSERDKRLIDNIRNELDEDEYQWRNLEMEETQLKVEIAELIMDQLYNENIEILEHIQFSRNRPDLYQNKSIYACEEIPKLSFQQTTTENAVKDKDDGDEVINV